MLIKIINQTTLNLLVSFLLDFLFHYVLFLFLIFQSSYKLVMFEFKQPFTFVFQFQLLIINSYNKILKSVHIYGRFYFFKKMNTF